MEHVDSETVVDQDVPFLLAGRMRYTRTTSRRNASRSNWHYKSTSAGRSEKGRSFWRK